MFWDIFPWSSLGGIFHKLFPKTRVRNITRKIQNTFEGRCPTQEYETKIPQHRKASIIQNFFVPNFPDISWFDQKNELCFINICTKYPWRNLGGIPQILRKKALKRKYLPKIFEEKSLPNNICREICTKNLRRAILHQINLEKTSSKIKSEENVFTKHVWR